MEVEIYKNHTLEWEISNFVKVWLSVIVSLCYCYVSAKVVPKGLPRFFTFIPLLSLFLVLPLNLHSMHLGGTSAFFISWLATFKLLLFAFHKGPLSDPSLSLPKFIAIGCFPIKIQQNPPPNSKSTQNPSQNGHNKESPAPMSAQNPSENGHSRENLPPKTTQKGQKSLWNYAIKGVLVGLFVQIYQYSDHIHPKIILIIYCFHIYFMLEIMLAMVAALARALLGLELEPQFNDPYLSTSLQDFWGRRWNLMVTRTLRPTVYDPVLYVATRIVGRKWAPLPAVLSTFVVSALMHELIFYYLGRSRPTWEITWFFLLHGVCVMVEIAIKKVLTGRCQLPRLISTPLTVAFVMVTGFWLFFPQLLRCKADVRAFEEYALLGAFLKDVLGQAAKLIHINPPSDI
ncbi:unnamed protein product [Camellia sinensis]